MALVAAVMGSSWNSSHLVRWSPPLDLQPNAALKRLMDGNQRFVHQLSWASRPITGTHERSCPSTTPFAALQAALIHAYLQKFCLMKESVTYLTSVLLEISWLRGAWQPGICCGHPRYSFDYGFRSWTLWCCHRRSPRETSQVILVLLLRPSNLPFPRQKVN